MNVNNPDLPMEEASVPQTEAVPELDEMIGNQNQVTSAATNSKGCARCGT